MYKSLGEEILMVTIPAGAATLEGHIRQADHAGAFVVFVHGSGSSRHSIRNNYVADRLKEGGVGSLLFDLLTREEDSARENRFDIDLLTDRVDSALDWLRDQENVSSSQLHLFGASTGAAAAIRAAADSQSTVRSVVSRGGRPDLAGDALGRVRCPCLLIVGENDPAVLDMNRQAQEEMTCENRLEIIPGATHLFQEQGALEQVARHALDWFLNH